MFEPTGTYYHTLADELSNSSVAFTVINEDRLLLKRKSSRRTNTLYGAVFGEKVSREHATGRESAYSALNSPVILMSTG